MSSLLIEMSSLLAFALHSFLDCSVPINSVELSETCIDLMCPYFLLIKTVNSAFCVAMLVHQNLHSTALPHPPLVSTYLHRHSVVFIPQ